MKTNHWQLQEAKNKLSSIVELAQEDSPQIVTKHGKDAVVIISIEEYKKLTKPEKNIFEFFQRSPLAKEELSLKRSKELPRKAEL